MMSKRRMRLLPSRRRMALLYQQQQLIMMISILIIAQKQQQDMVVAVAAVKESDVENYDHYLIACGNNVDKSSSELYGRNWFKDNPKYYSFSSSSMVAIAVEPDGTVSKIPFWTGRVSQANFTYKFPVKPGPKFVRLYFYSSTYNSFRSSGGNLIITRDRFFFTVVSNTGAVLLQNFTAAKATAKDSSDMKREFFLTIHPTSILELTFSPRLPSYYALVNGIEVVSASPNLLYRSSSAGGPPPPSRVPPSYQLRNFSIGEWSSLETMYRVNVGGPALQPTNDSAGSGSGRMYRHWESDDDGKGYELVQRPDYPPGTPVGGTILQVNYTASGIPEYLAPAQVYLMGKQMGYDYFSEKSRREKSNLTWWFEVDVGFSYLVRLHWCEMLPTVSSEGQRVFNVYVNHQVAEENVDLIAWGNGSRGIPIYRDYAVYQQEEQGGHNHLLLALRPVATGLVNVMLNGVEIFKANKSDSSLATPNTDPLQPTFLHNDRNSSHSHPHKHHHLVVVVIIIIIVAAVLVGIILLSLLLFRRSGGFSIYGSSSGRLSIDGSSTLYIYY